MRRSEAKEVRCLTISLSNPNLRPRKTALFCHLRRSSWRYSGLAIILPLFFTETLSRPGRELSGSSAPPHRLLHRPLPRAGNGPRHRKSFLKRLVD
jgi:hypothetical protein